jgi:hypothetical protein
MLAGLKPLAQMDAFHFCERVLGLALPNLYVWLLGFVIVSGPAAQATGGRDAASRGDAAALLPALPHLVASPKSGASSPSPPHSIPNSRTQIFHVWLNILGELTRFADRTFYKAWWNASSLDQFWRLWNMPVHTFLMRTLYFPVVRMGINKLVQKGGGGQLGPLKGGPRSCCVATPAARAAPCCAAPCQPPSRPCRLPLPPPQVVGRRVCVPVERAAARGRGRGALPHPQGLGLPGDGGPGAGPAPVGRGARAGQAPAGGPPAGGGCRPFPQAGTIRSPRPRRS